MSIMIPPGLSWIFLPLVGSAWPQGDEDALLRQANQLRTLGAGIVSASGGIDLLVNQVTDNVGGEVGRNFFRFGSKLTGFQGNFADSAAGLADALEAQANNLKSTKISMLTQAAFTGAQVLWALADPFTSELVPSFIAEGQAIVSRILLQLEKAAGSVLADAAKAVEQSAVARFTLDALKAAVQEAAREVGQDLATQGILNAVGVQHGLNWNSLGTSALTGAAGGAFAHGVGAGLAAHDPELAGSWKGAAVVEGATAGFMGAVSVPLGGDPSMLGWAILNGGLVGAATHGAHGLGHQQGHGSEAAAADAGAAAADAAAAAKALDIGNGLGGAKGVDGGGSPVTEIEPPPSYQDSFRDAPPSYSVKDLRPPFEDGGAGGGSARADLSVPASAPSGVGGDQVQRAGISTGTGAGAGAVDGSVGVGGGPAPGGGMGVSGAGAHGLDHGTSGPGIGLPGFPPPTIVGHGHAGGAPADGGMLGRPGGAGVGNPVPGQVNSGVGGGGRVPAHANGDSSVEMPDAAASPVGGPAAGAFAAGGHGAGSSAGAGSGHTAEPSGPVGAGQSFPVEARPVSPPAPPAGGPADRIASAAGAPHGAGVPVDGPRGAGVLPAGLSADRTGVASGTGVPVRDGIQDPRGSVGVGAPLEVSRPGPEAPLPAELPSSARPLDSQVPDAAIIERNPAAETPAATTVSPEPVSPVRPPGGGMAPAADLGPARGLGDVTRPTSDPGQSARPVDGPGARPGDGAPGQRPAGAGDHAQAGGSGTGQLARQRRVGKAAMEGPLHDQAARLAHEYGLLKMVAGTDASDEEVRSANEAAIGELQHALRTGGDVHQVAVDLQRELGRGQARLLGGGGDRSPDDLFGTPGAGPSSSAGHPDRAGAGDGQSAVSAGPVPAPGGPHLRGPGGADRGPESLLHSPSGASGDGGPAPAGERGAAAGGPGGGGRRVNFAGEVTVHKYDDERPGQEPDISVFPLNEGEHLPSSRPFPGDFPGGSKTGTGTSHLSGEVEGGMHPLRAGDAGLVRSSSGLAGKIAAPGRFSNKKRPGMAGSLLIGDKVIPHSSMKGGTPDRHSLVNEVLDGIPEESRGNGHGQCAEVGSISNYLHEQDPKGEWTLEEARAHFEKVGAATTAHAPPRKPGEEPRATDACATCEQLTGKLGIAWITRSPDEMAIPGTEAGSEGVPGTAGEGEGVPSPARPVPVPGGDGLPSAGHGTGRSLPPEPERGDGPPGGAGDGGSTGAAGGSHSAGDPAGAALADAVNSRLAKAEWPGHPVSAADVLRVRDEQQKLLNFKFRNTPEAAGRVAEAFMNGGEPVREEGGAPGRSGWRDDLFGTPGAGPSSSAGHPDRAGAGDGQSATAAGPSPAAQDLHLSGPGDSRPGPQPVPERGDVPLTRVGDRGAQAGVSGSSRDAGLPRPDAGSVRGVPARGESGVAGKPGPGDLGKPVGDAGKAVVEVPTGSKAVFDGSGQLRHVVAPDGGSFERGLDGEWSPPRGTPGDMRVEKTSEPVELRSGDGKPVAVLGPENEVVRDRGVPVTYRQVRADDGSRLPEPRTFVRDGEGGWAETVSGRPGGASPEGEAEAAAGPPVVRILVVSDVSGLGLGGVPVFNMELTRALAVRHHVTMLTVDPDPHYDAQAKAAQHGQARIINIPAPPDVEPRDAFGHLVDVGRPADYGLPDPASPDAFDLIIGHSRFSGPGALAIRTHWYPSARLVHFLHTSPVRLDAIKNQPHKGAVKAVTERRVMHQADLVTGVGPLLATEAARLSEQVIRVPAVHGFIPGTEIGDLVAPPVPGVDQFRLLLPGRASDEIKGVEDAFRAVGILRNERGRDVHLTVRGAPDPVRQPQEASVWQQKALALAGPGGVTLKPFSTSAAELNADRENAHAVIMPSKHEGFGLVATEAAGRGIPVLVNEESGAADFLRQFSRLGRPSIVPEPGDPAGRGRAWADAIEGLHDNLTVRWHDARVLHSTLRRYSWEAAGQALVDAAMRTVPAATRPPHLRPWHGDWTEQGPDGTLLSRGTRGDWQPGPRWDGSTPWAQHSSTAAQPSADAPAVWSPAGRAIAGRLPPMQSAAGPNGTDDEELAPGNRAEPPAGNGPPPQYPAPATAAAARPAAGKATPARPRPRSTPPGPSHG